MIKFWIVREADSSLWLYTETPPSRVSESGLKIWGNSNGHKLGLSNNNFPEITNEDREPTEFVYDSSPNYLTIKRLREIRERLGDNEVREAVEKFIWRFKDYILSKKV